MFVQLENPVGSAVESIMVNVIDQPVFVVKPPSSHRSLFQGQL